MDDLRFTSVLNFRTPGFYFRTVHSENQLSIYGALANGCDELTHQIPGQSFPSMEKSVAKVSEQLCRKLEPQHVGANTWDECSGSEGSTACLSRKI